MLGGALRPTVAGARSAVLNLVGAFLSVAAALSAKAVVKNQDSSGSCDQIMSASLVSLAHGTNDAQKTMVVITSRWSPPASDGQFGDPVPVKLGRAVSIAGEPASAGGASSHPPISG